MSLKFKIESVFMVEDRDLNEFIQEETGMCFYIAQDLEARNDSVARIIISGNISSYDKEEYIEFKSGGRGSYYHMSRTIMNNLCAEGKLEPGTYIIGICW